MDTGMYVEAKEYAEAVLKINPRSPEAKSLKGEAEFFLGDFERSFLTYSRGHNSRPSFGAFKLGYQMNGRAIDNALHPDEPIVFGNEDAEGIEELLSGEPLEELDDTEYEKSEQPKLYEDDIGILKELLSDEIVQSVHPACSYLLEYLEGRQKFWIYHDPKIHKL
ncbi:tetratricopeptide repeat protein 25 [Nephila pilipes]|uniref:Tetratricopeptide repeat protein 25 n=1 Tax=Nephila pilipes TaxID=299642 RepID=A0A8X6UW87_NEPPI|nr:tetratricopeptide repeat protein 25 [Nephila pilipes]